MNYQHIIDQYYPAGSPLRDIYMSHCRAVADYALELNARLPHPIDPQTVEAAAMLHDIGIFRCDAPSIECRGTLPYIAHGVEGARLLREAGAPEEIARVAERHTGSGITADEVRAQRLPIPEVDYLPETQIERLICYADKFYSKSGSPDRKPLESVRRQMARFGTDSLDRFDKLNAEFNPL